MNRSILIANRGEIACRIMRTCRKLGYRSIAVYSDADHDSMHVAAADEAVLIGRSAARDSYLNIEAILDAARRTGATAVHPGYGFLSESASFADAVEAAGLVWIGPSSKSLIDMGDKGRARAMARAAGLPILPGSGRFDVGQDGELLGAAALTGYPLLVKASAGGGGIGMRRVDQPRDLVDTVRATQSMAKKAFGSPDIYFEHYVRAARHIEVQVFGFGDGTSVHLYDRDCSIQRRFQKIVEEAPAPRLSDELRSRLHGAALALCNAQKYEGAGTVEFIYDNEKREFWFLEMNTRIQVEHAITEMITNTDLVEWQIEQAFGDLRKITQDQIKGAGHSIECRLYAERPEKGFLPAPGKIEALHWPDVDSRRLRIDTAVKAGDEVTSFYDPLIAKMVAYGKDRTEAVDRMRDALAVVGITGLRTNLEFLRAIMSDDDYSHGIVDTNMTIRVLDEWLRKKSS